MNSTTIEKPQDKAVKAIKQIQAQDDVDIYFRSDNPFPVEIRRQAGSFHPVDKFTGEISNDEIFKAEAFIHDPSKRHPTFYHLFSANEQREKGFYLAVPSLGYFNGKFETSLQYESVDEEKFKKAKEKNKDSRKNSWDTGLEVEVYTHEKQGSGFSHESYLLDTIRNEPILMDCWQRDVLKAGIYDLSVKLHRIKGSLKPLNVYTFNREIEE